MLCIVGRVTFIVGCNTKDNEFMAHKLLWGKFIQINDFGIYMQLMCFFVQYISKLLSSTSLRSKINHYFLWKRQRLAKFA